MKQAFVARRVVTCDPARASDSDPLGAIADGCVLVEDGRVRWVGSRAEAALEAASVVDVGELLTPALVDAHTHAAWMGSRHGEYEVRLRGGDYVAIAAAGGGIASTQREVAASSVEQIASVLEARLARMAALGVATVEVKSGYGLVPQEELKLLSAIARVSERKDLPRVVPTYLALHAIPKDLADRRAAYVDAARELVGEIARARLAKFVDAYVDPHAFTVAEARIVGEAARSHGLGVRLHVGQFGDVGGAELAAGLGAASADHLEHVGERGIEALARHDVSAGLLPIASFTLGQAPPPVARLREAGVRMIVASDANPGTAPSESLPLAMAFAVRAYGLTPVEAILGATRNAAASLRGVATGTISVGAPADLAAWDLPHETCILQPWGTARTRGVWRDGVEIARSQRVDGSA